MEERRVDEKWLVSWNGRSHKWEERLSQRSIESHYTEGLRARKEKLKKHLRTRNRRS